MKEEKNKKINTTDQCSFVSDKLLETEAKYQAIFNAVPDAIVVISNKGLITNLNNVFVSWLGYGREELLGKKVLEMDFLPKETKQIIKSRWNARFTGQTLEPCEIELINKKKERRIVLLRGNAVRNSNNEITEDLVLLSDITEQKARDQKQRELDERYKAIFNASPDVIVLLSQQGVILEVNDLVEKWLKYKKSEVVGKTLFELDFLTPESLKKVKEVWKRRFAGEKIESYELEFFNKKNEIRTGLVEGNLVKDNDGKFIQDLVIISDITERKKMVETMKVEQENFKNIVNAQFEAIVILDWKGKILFVNDATLKFGKYKSREEIVGKNGFSIIHPDSRLSMIKDLANTHLGKGGYLNEYKFIDSEGNTIYAESLGGLINYEGEKRAFVTLRDITEKKKTEEALKTSQEKYVKLFESLGEGIVMVDMNGKIMECNPAYARLLGYSRDEVLKLTYQQLTPKKWEATEMDIVKNEIIAKGVSDEYEKEYIRKDGSIVAVVLKTWLIKNASGQPMGMWAIVRDVTKEKQGISELKHERDLAEKYFNTSPNLVVVLDRNQKVVAINQAGSQLLGHKTEDVVGKDWFANFVPTKDADGLRAKFVETVTTPKKKIEESFSAGWVNSVLTKSKEERQIEWQSSTIFDENGNFSKVISSGIDITERLKYEETLKEKVSELERINKLMVGREMKMVELKERIKELEKK